MRPDRYCNQLITLSGWTKSAGDCGCSGEEALEVAAGEAIACDDEEDASVAGDADPVTLM